MIKYSLKNVGLVILAIVFVGGLCSHVLQESGRNHGLLLRVQPQRDVQKLLKIFNYKPYAWKTK